MSEVKGVGPFFSVLVPCYNVEEFLSDCLFSVINQTYTNWEMVAVDDGSTDSTGYILDSIAKLMPGKIKVLHTKNQGQLMARCKAASKASGRYAVFLDSDDALRRDALELLAQSIGSASNIIAVFKMSRNPDFSDPLWLPHPSGKGPWQVDTEWLRKEVCKSDSFNTLAGKAFPLQYYPMDIGTSLARVSMAEDLLQLVYVLDMNCDVVVLDECLYYYRINSESITQNYDPGHYRSAKVAHETLCKHAKDWGSDEFESLLEKRWIENVTRIIIGLSKSNLSFSEIMKQLNTLGQDAEFRKAYAKHGCTGRTWGRKVAVALLAHRAYMPLCALLKMLGRSKL